MTATKPGGSPPAVTGRKCSVGEADAWRNGLLTGMLLSPMLFLAGFLVAGWL